MRALPEVQPRGELRRWCPQRATERYQAWALQTKEQSFQFRSLSSRYTCFFRASSLQILSYHYPQPSPHQAVIQIGLLMESVGPPPHRVSCIHHRFQSLCFLSIHIHFWRGLYCHHLIKGMRSHRLPRVARTPRVSHPRWPTFPSFTRVCTSHIMEFKCRRRSHQSHRGITVSLQRRSLAPRGLLLLPRSGTSRGRMSRGLRS